MKIGTDDYKTMSAPTDFFGLNIYNRVLVDKDKTTKGKLLTGGNVQDTSKGTYAKVVYDVPKLLRETYDLKIPIIVTENGCPSYVHEFKGFNKTINDKKRIEYIKDFLSWIEKANADGLNIKGYYAWSLMDNIEWCAGPMMKYGLLHTNFRTFETTWKKSAYFYRDFIKSHS